MRAAAQVPQPPEPTGNSAVSAISDVVAGATVGVAGAGLGSLTLIGSNDWCPFPVWAIETVDVVVTYPI